MSGPAMRPMPADFHLYAHETFPQLCERFRAGYHAVRRWLIEGGYGLGDKTGKTKRKYAPADYATKFDGMSRRAIAKELGVSTDTLQRWDREQGITRPRHKPGRRPVVRPALRVSIVPTYMTAPVGRPHLDMSYAGRAAEYLRRFGPVIRCDAKGRFDIAGTHWRRGSTLLDAAQIVDRAVRNGFDADAWKRVA